MSYSRILLKLFLLFKTKLLGCRTNQYYFKIVFSFIFYHIKTRCLFAVRFLSTHYLLKVYHQNTMNGCSYPITGSHWQFFIIKVFFTNRTSSIATESVVAFQYLRVVPGFLLRRSVQYRIFK